MELICTKSTKHQSYVFPFSRRKGSPALVIHTNGTENFSRFDESRKKLVIPQMVFFFFSEKWHRVELFCSHPRVIVRVFNVNTNGKRPSSKPYSRR